jgi:hypothetical protein
MPRPPRVQRIATSALLVVIPFLLALAVLVAFWTLLTTDTSYWPM